MLGMSPVALPPVAQKLSLLQTAKKCIIYSNKVVCMYVCMYELKIVLTWFPSSAAGVQTILCTYLRVQPLLAASACQYSTYIFESNTCIA